MKLLDIKAAVESLTAKVNDFGTKLAAMAKTTVENITAEAATALRAEIKILTDLGATLKTDLTDAVTSLAEASTTITALQTELGIVKAALVDKQKIATNAAAAAAGLTADQGVEQVAAGTDAAADGKTPEQKLRAQLSAKDISPKARGEIAAKLRELRGVSFKQELVKATK
jgi:predicted  nucleic acid-binding Zn-ribbon protein